MKVREIITERQQLNEVAPLAFLAPYLPAALAWIATAGWFAILAAGAAAWSTYETIAKMKGIVETEGPDPTKWSPETQYEVASDIAASAVAAALGPAWSAAKKTYDKVWKSTPPEIKKQVFDKALPEINKVIEKTGVKAKNPNLVDKPYSKDAAPVAKDPNKVERPFSKDAAPTSPSTAPPPGGAGAFSQMAQQMSKTTKNPNRVERPFSKQ
jgi:hypothetical protein